MRCASSSTAATIPSGWSIRAIPSSGRRVSGSAHDGRFSEVLTHPRDDGVMIGASLRALLALFAILTATAVIAPAYAERVAAPSRPDPAGAAVEALIASATRELPSPHEQAAAQALAAARRIRRTPPAPHR